MRKNKIKQCLRKLLSFGLLCSLFMSATFPSVSAEDLMRDSVENKTAPSVIEQVEVVDGVTYSWRATIHDPAQDDKLIHRVETENVFVTPYVERTNITHNVPDFAKDLIEYNLDRAYSDIRRAKRAGELCKPLDDIAVSYDPSFNSNVFTVTDLFDLTVSQYYYDELKANPDFFVRITFDLDYTNAKYAPVVIHRVVETEVWEIAKSVTINEDGTLTAEFIGLCPIAILNIDPIKVPIKGDKDTCVGGCEKCHCPSWCFFCRIACTSSRCFCLLLLIAIIVLSLVIALLIWYFVSRKEEEEEKKIEDKEEKENEDEKK